MKKIFSQKNTCAPILVVNSSRGFVILFAVLVSAIILLIGAGIFSISFKETVLSSMARESQISINAADAGVECAIYVDLLGGGLTPGNSVPCNNQLSTQVDSAGGFLLENLGPSQESCAIVESQKAALQSGSTTQMVTIVSRGFNICDTSGPITTDPILVERVYRVKYQQTPVVITP